MAYGEIFEHFLLSATWKISTFYWIIDRKRVSM